MKTLLLILACCLILPLGSLFAQTCADVDGNTSVDISDIARMIYEHAQGTPLVTGRGDMDGRQGYNSGDTRFLMDYIFWAGPVPTCPPFPIYTLFVTNDTIFLPSYTVPAGTGSFQLPILLLNHSQVGDLVLPLKMTGLGNGLVFDSLQRPMIIRQGVSTPKWSNGDFTSLAFSTIDQVFEPGLNLLAVAHFHYTASPGGTLSMDTTTLGPHTFLNYVHGTYATWSVPADLSVGIPRVVVASHPPYPTMSVDRDTLSFQILIGESNPVAKSFTISSDDIPFAWNITTPYWVSVSALSGISGQSIDVNPEVAGLPIGTKYGTITIASTAALGSPKTVVVKLVVKQQYMSLDANCDGTYNISDVVYQVQYIFGSGVTPCNPCTGVLIEK